MNDVDQTDFTFIERMMLQHAVPLELAWDGLGVIVGIQLLRHRHLVLGISSILGRSVLGNVLVWHRDPQQLAASSLGQWDLNRSNGTDGVRLERIGTDRAERSQRTVMAENCAADCLTRSRVTQSSQLAESCFQPIPATSVSYLSFLL